MRKGQNKMKALLTLFLVIHAFTVRSEVSLSDCLTDSQYQAHEKTPLQPLPECVEIIKADPSHVSVSSSDNLVRAYGIGHMIYVDSLDSQGVLIESSLLAGSQTELVSVNKLFIDKNQNRLLVIQNKNGSPELMLQNLSFIGNTSPLKVMRSDVFNAVTSAKYRNADEIEIINAVGTFVVKADGESRKELSSFKALEIIPE